MPLYRVPVSRNPKVYFCFGFSENVDIRFSNIMLECLVRLAGGDPWKIVWRNVLLTLSAARPLKLKLKEPKGGNGFYQITGLRRV